MKALQTLIAKSFGWQFGLLCLFQALLPAQAWAAKVADGGAAEKQAVMLSLGPNGLQWHVLSQPVALPVAPAQESALAAQYAQIALGSIWKLFVFVYLQQNAINEAPFACTGNQRDDEQYCCEAGQSVAREMALARSCGPYFAPQRVGIQADEWRRFWQKTLPQQGKNHAWLLQLRNVRPDFRVAPGEVLQALAALPVNARDAARSALLQSSLQGTMQEALPQLGSAPRVKTFTWHHPRHAGMRLGGGVGWLANGNLFWFAGNGSSRMVLQRWGAALASHLQVLAQQPNTLVAASQADEACVEVEFFKRYPIQSVQALDAASQPIASKPMRGTLQGRYRLKFENGNLLEFQTQGQLQAQSDARGRWHITGRFALNDYVARVVEREGDASKVAAARALAVAARTYLLQNGVLQGSCYLIADDSRRQRVAPNRPSDAAFAAAWFSDGLILDGVAVRYHRDQAKPGVMAWSEAVTQSDAGWQFDQILRAAYPHAVLRGMHGGEDCQRLPASQAWLEKASRRWQARLQSEVGFERLPQAPLVCALDYGNPYSDQRRLRVYVRPRLEREERFSLAHEYLHLSFRFHPRGLDEAYLEQWARKLVDGELAQDQSGWMKK